MIFCSGQYFYVLCAAFFVFLVYRRIQKIEKLREKDGSAHCKPTFIRIVGELVLDLVLNLDIFDFVVLVIWRGESLPNDVDFVE